MPLIGNVPKPLDKSGSIPLGLIEAAPATDAAIHKNVFGTIARRSDLALSTAIIISNEEINDIIKIVKSLEESGLLIKGVSETVKNEVKEHKREILGITWDTLGASLLGNLWTSKGTIRTDQNF